MHFSLKKRNGAAKIVCKKTCKKSHQKAKDVLTPPAVLTHYDPELHICLACDPYPYGVGAVILHICPDGEEKIIAFASRTLSKPEQN